MTRKSVVAKSRKENPSKPARAAGLGDSILRGLRQALAHGRGQLTGTVEEYNVPPAVNVREVRWKSGLSQAEFANRYGFNRRSLQDWEQGRRTPDSAARAYLMVIAHNPKAVDRALFQKAS
jgi:putative transcriptional regulator